MRHCRLMGTEFQLCKMKNVSMWRGCDDVCTILRIYLILLNSHLKMMMMEGTGWGNKGRRLRNFCSVSCVQLFVSPWTAACQASQSFTISWSLLKLMSIESVMPSNHLILWCSVLLLSSICPSISVFFQWVNYSHHMAKRIKKYKLLYLK